MNRRRGPKPAPTIRLAGHQSLANGDCLTISGPMPGWLEKLKSLPMASKWQSASMIVGEFDRALDEVFEDLLIKRWRRPGQVRNLGRALVMEDEETYRVKIALPDADPAKLEVEVSQWRLAVRTPNRQGESTLDFSHRIDTEAVTARFQAGILEVIAPKARGRKIEVR